jgi:hypothetical protein
MSRVVQCSFNTKTAFWESNARKYICFVSQETIDEFTELLFVGDHAKGKSDKDVVAIQFNHCELIGVPQGLTKAFPNLSSLQFQHSNLARLERTDLKEYTAVTEFHFSHGLIPYIPGDLFLDLKSLEVVRIRHIWAHCFEPGLLNSLRLLKVVDFTDLNGTKKELSFSTVATYRATNNLGDVKKVLNRGLTTQWGQLYKIKRKSENVSNDLRRAMQNKKLKDFTITVGEEDFKAHKIMLAARSPVFARMIDRNLDADSLNLVDISSDVFQTILDFIYTDDLPSTPEVVNWAELMAASEKLEIRKLADYAAMGLVHSVTADNAIEMLALGNKFNHTLLRERSFNEIKKFLNAKTLDENFASQPDKLKKLIDIKKGQIQLQKQLEEQFKSVLYDK